MTAGPQGPCHRLRSATGAAGASRRLTDRFARRTAACALHADTGVSIASCNSGGTPTPTMGTTGIDEEQQAKDK